jgi:hypothetical protein
VLVDVIKDIRNEWIPNIGENFNYEAAGQFLSDVEKFCKQSGQLVNSVYNSQQLEEAVWRVPIGDMEMTTGGIPFRRRATSSSCQARQDLLKIIAALQIPADQNVDQYEGLDMNTLVKSGQSYTSIMRDMHNRRPYISKQGYVGLGPISMLPGDVICIFLGAQLPYILRRTETDLYKLIGEGYVHGIMDGEYIERKPRRERIILL